jgi:hypothetical protein
LTRHRHAPRNPALDRYLLPVIGLAELDDNVKQLSGRVLRQVVEHLGGQHERKGLGRLSAPPPDAKHQTAIAGAIAGLLR